MFHIINLVTLIVLLSLFNIGIKHKTAWLLQIIYMFLISFTVLSMVNNSTEGYFDGQFHVNVLFVALGFIVLLFVSSLSTMKFGMYVFSILGFSLASANNVKMSIIGSPIVYGDLQNNLIKEVVLDMVIKQHPCLSLLVITCLVVATYLYIKYIKSAIWPAKVKVVCFFTTLALITGMVIYFNQAVDSRKEIIKAQPAGFIKDFTGSFDEEVFIKPVTYSEKTMNAITEKYSEKYGFENKSERKENIIYILSESLIDPTKFPKTEWKEDPMPTIHQLQKENGGSMLSTQYGGGTGNVEYSLISGFDFNEFKSGGIAYNELLKLDAVNFGYPKYFEDKQMEVLGLHPYSPEGYKRNEVYDKLKFTEFISINEMKKNDYDLDIYTDEGYASDDSFVQSILKEVEERETPVFINSLSMQNHFPYTEKSKGELSESENLLKNKNSNPDFEELARYARGVKKTDDAIKLLIDQLSKLDEPTTVVFYGDHAPALNKALYENDFFEDDYQLEMHKTPYFVWRNDNKNMENPELINPGFLGALALDNSSLNSPAFYQFEADLLKEVPAFRKVSNQYFNLKGENYWPSKEVRTAIEDYRLIQYDMFVGGNYSKALFE